MDDRTALNQTLAALAAIMKMSDAAQALGGAASIAGVASLHKMQTSIQKNGPRLAEILRAINDRPGVANLAESAPPLTKTHS